MRWTVKSLALAAFLLPGAAAAQVPNFPQNLPANTVIGRLGTGPGPSQAIPFATLSTRLTGAAITLNSGNGQTAPGAMSGGNTYSFGANTDTPRFAGIGLGGVAPATGLEVYNAPISPTGNGQGMLGASSLNGGVFLGQGSVFDAAIENKSGAIALGVTTGTQNVVLQGTLTAASLSTAGTIAGSLCMTSGGLVLYEVAVNCFAVSGISVVSGKVLTVDNTIELAGTDGTKFTFPGANDTVDTLAANQTVSGNKTFSGTLNITGTGQLNGTAFGTFATQNFATPPAIGGTTPAAGAFSTLSATTPIGLASGGTNAGTAAGARASGGLNVESFTAKGDTSYTILATDRVVGTTTSLTAPRTWTLPASSAVNPGQSLLIADYAGGVTNTNTLTITRAGTDTVNGATSVTINVTNGAYELVADGVSKWTAQALGAAATVGVASINGQTGNPSIVAGTGVSVNTSGGNITVASTLSSGGGIIASSGNALVEQMNPGGRLTLSSGVPVMTTDQAGATTIYYAPYVGKYVPIYDGTNMILRQFTSSDADTVGLSIALGSNWAANTIYDGFIGLNSGVVTFCTGPAWTNSGAGTSARSAALALFKGLQTNSASMTCRFNNTTTFTCGINQCTYVGSFITNGSTGTIDFKGPSGSVGAGGVLDCICVFNAYNQVRGRAFNGDSTSTWTYTTATFRQADGSTSNQVNILQGLTGQTVHAENQCMLSNTSAGLDGGCGIGIDSTSANSATLNFAQTIVSSVVPSTGIYTGSLSVGFHNIVRLEYSQVAGTTTWFGSGAAPAQTGMNVEFFW